MYISIYKDIFQVVVDILFLFVSMVTFLYIYRCIHYWISWHILNICRYVNKDICQYIEIPVHIFPYHLINLFLKYNSKTNYRYRLLYILFVCLHFIISVFINSKCIHQKKCYLLHLEPPLLMKILRKICIIMYIHIQHLCLRF